MTIRHGGPCGLRIEMRSAERDGKSVVFSCRNARFSLPHAQRGGVRRSKAADGPVVRVFSATCRWPLFRCGLQ